ncbi:expressed unknown protein [Seminavis robusta]|uniref:Uncharacterized protein n=1 Tax=Seminavis robusta TaxID=568900 RepID=A0A9N8HW75_9STRA|nr:expressed unknown protein [Seminavis robusta]|eukprot:Sro2105_g314750.1 n/a (318) ;mRNA; f:6506-7459
MTDNEKPPSCADREEGKEQLGPFLWLDDGDESVSSLESMASFEGDDDHLLGNDESARENPQRLAPRRKTRTSALRRVRSLDDTVSPTSVARVTVADHTSGARDRPNRRWGSSGRLTTTGSLHTSSSEPMAQLCERLGAQNLGNGNYTSASCRDVTRWNGGQCRQTIQEYGSPGTPNRRSRGRDMLAGKAIPRCSTGTHATTSSNHSSSASSGAVAAGLESPATTHASNTRSRKRFSSSMVNPKLTVADTSGLRRRRGARDMLQRRQQSERSLISKGRLRSLSSFDSPRLPSRKTTNDSMSNEAIRAVAAAFEKATAA